MFVVEVMTNFQVISLDYQQHRWIINNALD